MNLRDLFCGDEVHSATDKHPFQVMTNFVCKS